MLGVAEEVCNPTDAEDAVQDALAAAHRNWADAKFDSPRMIRHWLYVIVRSKALNRIRNRARRRRMETPSESLSILQPSSDVDSPASGDPLEALVESRTQEKRRREIDAAIFGLSPKLSRVTRLRLEGLEAEQIGRVMSIPVQTVHTRFHRARPKLQVLLRSQV